MKEIEGKEQQQHRQHQHYSELENSTTSSGSTTGAVESNVDFSGGWQADIFGVTYLNSGQTQISFESHKIR